jgi:hypothetical protein
MSYFGGDGVGKGEREVEGEKKTKLSLELEFDNGVLVSFMSRNLLLELDT